MNICEQTKIKMLEGVSLSVEEQSHLESCADCRMSAELLKRMEQLPVMEEDVPAYLDKTVLQAASAALPKRRWKPVIWKVAVPMAAAFAFAAGLLFYQPSEKQDVQVVFSKVPVVKTRHVYELNDENFDDKVLALAIDVGSGMDSLTESVESVNDELDFII